MTLPRSLVYIIERYKLAFLLTYGAICAILTLPLMGFLGHAQANQASLPVYQVPVYPIINKLPTPVDAQASVFSDSSQSIWPIHGIVTTQFGVYHKPYQPTHTGIDISSAKPAGATPVMAFRAGTVVQVIHSNVGYGNHVIIDHGGGLTSLYGHLANTVVEVGQQVNAGDIIGHEGSTGDSTGPHVHFETDVYGKPTNPHDFVQGAP